ncbi:MAG: hypothetical protein QF654_00595 [Alphaproteobacteria bacterium]|jgi:hypothetical protein|nr:hypothetical protein [Alphaproteobacteria bacterium]
MPTYKLPVWEVVKEVYRFVWAARRDLVAIASVPVLGLTIFITVMTEVFGAPGMFTDFRSRAGSEDYLVWPMNIVAMAIYVMFAVAWHRRYLVPGERMTVWTALRWDARKTRFLLRLIGASVLGLLVMLAPMALVSVGVSTAVHLDGNSSVADSVVASMATGIAGLVLLHLIYGRLFLWLPAAAVDDPTGLRGLWRLGRRNTWRLFWIVVAVGLPFWFLAIVSIAMPAFLVEPGLTARLIVHLASQAVGYLGIAITVSALSASYRRLKDAAPPVPAE